MRWSTLPLTPAHLTLANTLPVGQSFLWHHRNGVYSRSVDNPPRVVFLRQSPTAVEYAAVHPDQAATDADVENGVTKRWLEDYLQLRYDLHGLYSDWRTRDAGLFGKTELDTRAIGVRVLRQDPWECLIAFITSTNNHITRISSLMHKLTTAYSPPLMTVDETTYHLFPAPHQFPTAGLEKQLRDLGFGYRAAFIESTLATLKARFGDEPGAIEAGLLAYRTAPLEEVRENLIELKGVGRKVADCVMLMCMDQPGLIPIDTHLAAIAARHPQFPSRLKKKPMSKALYDEVQGFLEERWGEMGGWCQAVMFAADLKPKKVKEEDVVKMEEGEQSDGVKEEDGVRSENGVKLENGAKLEEGVREVNSVKQKNGVSTVASRKPGVTSKAAGAGTDGSVYSEVTVVKEEQSITGTPVKRGSAAVSEAVIADTARPRPKRSRTSTLIVNKVEKLDLE